MTENVSTQGMNRMSTKKLTRLSLLAAISVMLVAAIRIPFPPAPFLELDFADVPILIATFAYGPLTGFILTIVVSLVQGITVSAASGVIGIIMHILSTGSFVLVAGTIYSKGKTRKSALIGLLLGAITLTIVMVAFNLIFTPIFMGQPVETVMAMIIPVFIPFNLLKGVLNGTITFILYKSISNYLK